MGEDESEECDEVGGMRNFRRTFTINNKKFQSVFLFHSCNPLSIYKNLNDKSTRQLIAPYGRNRANAIKSMSSISFRGSKHSTRQRVSKCSSSSKRHKPFGQQKRVNKKNLSADPLDQSILSMNSAQTENHMLSRKPSDKNEKQTAPTLPNSKSSASLLSSVRVVDDPTMIGSCTISSDLFRERTLYKNPNNNKSIPLVFSAVTRPIDSIYSIKSLNDDLEVKSHQMKKISYSKELSKLLVQLENVECDEQQQNESSLSLAKKD